MPSPPPFQGVRVRLIYKDSDNFLAGNRFYLAYSGSAPTPANCITLAGDVSTQWASHLAPVTTDDWSLTEVDVLDLATTSGASGQDTTVHAGTEGTGAVQASVCMNVEYNIARRYRGGKPRIYWPGPPAAGLADNSHWGSSTLTSFNSATSAFFAALNALSIGAMGTLQHSNVSFFHGKNTASPPWRGPGYKYPPAYRATALVDTVEGYSAKAEIGSQKRRRTALTP